MLKVGVTGGIGSGKSVVCKVFTTLGIPVLKADDVAKGLMNHDQNLMAAIKALLGEGVYQNGILHNVAVSAIIFNNPEKLQQLNALVHPATIRYSENWISKQTSPYTIKEAAIFFESGSEKGIDVMIGVYCPLETRIERVMQRSHLSREKVIDIVAKQMGEDEKMKRCDYVITNDDKVAVLPQVLALHEMLLDARGW
jgi:dephospho-CoA kinase